MVFIGSVKLHLVLAHHQARETLLKNSMYGKDCPVEQQPVLNSSILEQQPICNISILDQQSQLGSNTLAQLPFEPTCMFGQQACVHSRRRQQVQRRQVPAMLQVVIRLQKDVPSIRKAVKAM